MNTNCYKSNSEYLQDQMRIIDAYLAQYSKVFVEKLHTSGKTHLKRTCTNLEEMEHALTQGVFHYEESPEEIDELKDLVNNRIYNTLKNNQNGENSVFLPFEYLSSIFKLTDFERFVVMLSFAVEIDRKYEKIFGFLNDYGSMRHPTVQTACMTYNLADNVLMKNMTKFHSNSKLMKYFFKDDDTSLAGMQLKLMNTIVGFLLDADLETIVMPEYLRLYMPDEDPGTLHTHHLVKERLGAYLSNLETVDSRRIVMNINGPEGIGKLKQVKNFCHNNNHAAVIMNANLLDWFYNDSRKSYRKVLKELAQILLIHQAVLVIDDVEMDENSDLVSALFEDFLSDIAKFVKVTFILSDKEIPSITRPDHEITILRIKMDHPSGQLRKSIFDNSISKFRYDVSADLDSIASKFLFTPEQIENAVYDAVELTKWQNKDHIDSHTLHVACRSQLNHNLHERARRIESGGSWDQLILPKSSKKTLSEICSHVKYKSHVLDTWKFKEHLSYGTGLAALFAGPPGTGKTYSARILAKELDLELYKVDLSQMISKYIGETEKNISALFEDAAGSSAILLFDEGDALFGKRTEMKDSHDRYANVETAFLLQKVEAYEGISLLTTNFMQNIDPAFLRRFRFVVHFPIPDVESRLQIWKGIYPEQVPISKHVDFEFLAKTFELTGGHIKNVALSSAFKAASNDGKVDMKSIMLSIQHELGKTGKAVLRSDFGEFAYMLDES